MLGDAIESCCIAPEDLYVSFPDFVRGFQRPWWVRIVEHDYLIPDIQTHFVIPQNERRFMFVCFYDFWLYMMLSYGT